MVGEAANQMCYDEYSPGSAEPHRNFHLTQHPLDRLSTFRLARFSPRRSLAPPKNTQISAPLGHSHSGPPSADLEIPFPAALLRFEIAKGRSYLEPWPAHWLMTLHFTTQAGRRKREWHVRSPDCRDL